MNCHAVLSPFSCRHREHRLANDLILRCCNGQKKGDNGAATAWAVAASQSDTAPMAFHDLGANPQAESGAADSLGCKEGLKQPCARLRWYSAAVIGNGKEKTNPARTPFRTFAASDHQSAAMGHGIDSVTYHVGEHLAYIPFKAFDWLLLIPARFNLDVRVFKPPFINNKHRLKEALRADQLRPRGLFMEP